MEAPLNCLQRDQGQDSPGELQGQDSPCFSEAETHLGNYKAETHLHLASFTKAETHCVNPEAKTHRHLHQGRHHLLPPPSSTSTQLSGLLAVPRGLLAIGGTTSEAPRRRHPLTVCDLTKAETHLGDSEAETHL